MQLTVLFSNSVTHTSGGKELATLQQVENPTVFQTTPHWKCKKSLFQTIMSLSSKWYVKGGKLSHTSHFFFFLFVFFFLFFFFLHETNINGITCHVFHLLVASHIFRYIFICINTFLKNSNIQPHVLKRRFTFKSR